MISQADQSHKIKIRGQNKLKLTITKCKLIITPPESKENNKKVISDDNYKLDQI
jgi:hypothetical protein